MAHAAASWLAGLLVLASSVRGVPLELKPTTTFSGEATGVPSPFVISVQNVTSHGSFTGPAATVTGALSTSVQATSLAPAPPPAQLANYSSDGKLHAPEPLPFTPSGGIGTNGSLPLYKPASDFDYQSLALALYHEWIELDLFHWGLATFSDAEFDAWNITANDRFLLQHMADQELGHATLISNMLGPQAPKQCTYNYPVSDVREFIDFNQKLTRWSEAGVYGFLPHLNSGPAAQMLLQTVTIEARQQLIFRQFGGQFPMPEWHTPGIPQSWAWTLIAPYISSCPRNQTRMVWQNFPSLSILNQPNPARLNPNAVWNETTGGYANTLSTQGIPRSQLCVNSTNATQACPPAIAAQNLTIPLSYPGRQVFLQWDAPGKAVGPNGSYVTSTSAKEPRFAAWLSQLNVTYSVLRNVSAQARTAYTFQPNVSTWIGDPAINGTMFLALTDLDVPVSPYNVSAINPHVAALAVYQAG